MADGCPHRYDLTETFDIRVGQEPDHQTFSVHHDVITPRSAHLHALRVEQTTNFPDLPVIVLDEDPEVFAAYLHCVYFGADSLMERIALMAEEHVYFQGNTGIGDTGDVAEEPVEKFLINFHLLAGKLVDLMSADMAIDALAALFEKRDKCLTAGLVGYVYESTVAASPLRRLIRDYSLIDNVNIPLNIEKLHGTAFPPEYTRDILLRVLAINRENANKVVRKVHSRKALQRDRYHHDFDQTRLPASLEELESPSCSDEEGKPLRKRRRLERSEVEEKPKFKRKSDGPTVSANVVLRRYVYPCDAKRPILTLLCSPLAVNKWWSVSQEQFDDPSLEDKQRYAAVANAMESGTSKKPACKRCMRLARDGLADLADCKVATPGGRCGPCFWDRAPHSKRCPRPKQ